MSKHTRDPLDETPFQSPRQLLGPPPPTVEDLHDWLALKLGIRIARRAIVPGHQSPFDYLCHAFYEGCIPPSSPREPAPPQRSPDCIVWANRGGGKTWLGALATLLDLLFKPGIQVRILGGSLDQSLRMREYLAALFGIEALARIPHHIGAKRITVFHDPEKRTKSIVEVLAASQTSVRGTRVQKLRCDEVDLFDPEVWQAAQLVTRSMPCEEGPWGKVIRGSVEALSTMHRPFGLMWNLVGPPPARPAPRSTVMRSDVMMSEEPDPTLLTPHHPHPSSSPAPKGPHIHPPRPTFRWGVLDVLEHCTDEHTCDTCLLFEDCQGRAKTHLTPKTSGHLSIADAVGQKARVAPETWQSEMLCLRPSRSDTVYPMFDAATHVVGDPPPGSPPFVRFLGGMDFGFRSEGVLLLAGVDADGGLTVLREHIRTGVVLEDYIAALERWIASGLCSRAALDFLGVDPAGAAQSDQTGQANIKILRDRGYRVKHRPSDIHYGVRLVQARLDPATLPSGQPARPRLLIHHSCTRLIECLTRYHYDKNRPEDLNPVKDGHDHAPDALRYMILNFDASDKVTFDSY